MALVIRNLCKFFAEKVIFDHFNYTFSDTGIYVLLGKSGRGKTTFLRIIAGLDKEYSGTVTSERVAFSFQEYRLFPTLTALENITKILWENPTEAKINEAKALLKTLGFSDADTDRYPNELSGGMKQRVSLCRALLSEKKVLLLDEPFKEIDDTLCEKLRSILKQESKRRLIILTTHNLEILGDLEKTVFALD